MRRLLAALVAGLSFCSLLGPADAARKPKKDDDLLRIIAPAARGTVSAHPHVNVIVEFGFSTNGIPVDPNTFKARLGRRDVTGDFEPVMKNGVQTGLRASFDRAELRIGRRRTNRLRFFVQGTKAGKRRPRDIDRVRFRAVESPNQGPVADINPEAEVVVPNVPFKLDASRSFDPDSDKLTYFWDFGDGQTSTEATPLHRFEVSDDIDVTIKLTVSDGQSTSEVSRTLFAVPPIPPDTTPGALKITADESLEFGAMPTGSTTTRILHIANTDPTPNSWVALRLAVDGASFSVSPSTLDLPAGVSQDVTVTYTAGAGHEHAVIGMVAAATNRNFVSLLTHGYGGDGQGTGPSLAAAPVFYTELLPALFGFGARAIMPNGTRVSPDNGVRTCTAPLNGPGTGDFCVSDVDCAPNGGTCQTSAQCIGGDNTGGTCSVPGDCPNGFCPAYSIFDPLEMCGDGQGGLYLLSDEGAFTDPAPTEFEELSLSVLRLSMDENGNVTDRQIIDHANTDTQHIACDGFSAAAGGRVYLAEYQEIPEAGPNCFRSEKERLTAVRKSNGNNQTVMPRIDAALGLNDCEDDVDLVGHLEVSPDGGQVYASFELSGLWRIRPTPLQFSPDPDELFRLHPDGSVILASTTDGPTSGVVKVQRISPAQVAVNPLPLASVTPCASFHVFTNGNTQNPGRSGVIGYAVGPSSPGSKDATILVTIATSSNRITEVLSSNLVTRATLAFTAPADSTTCQFAGIVNLETLDQLTF